MKNQYLLISLWSAMFSTLIPCFAEDSISPSANPLTVAIFDFVSTDESTKDLGPKIAALINAELSTDPNIITVERAELEKALGEQELGLSGTVQSDTAARVGHLTGAQVLVTGRVFKVEKEIVMVAKVIGTETSRVYGEAVKSPSGVSITDLASQLAKKIGAIVSQKADTLVAKEISVEERIEKIARNLKSTDRSTVEVSIPEKHFSGPTFDPAAQTELSYILQKCGFTIVDDKSKQTPKFEFIGEAISEFGMRKGNLVSCKGRVELKLRNKESGHVLKIDRQTSVAVDLSEQVAAKKALQRAAMELAERMIPEMVK